MRDKDRIQKLLDYLEVYWNQNPDLRFSQIVNFLKTGKSIYKKDFYFAEDEEIIQELKEMIYK